VKIPQYRKLYILLRDHIKEGIYKEGDLLQSENELSVLHNLTRQTVRHALEVLVSDGYIKKYQGKGSIVTAPSKEIGILSIQGTTSAIGKKNLKTKIIRKPYIKHWKLPFFFDISQREIESGCIVLERIRLVNDKPVFYDITYLPNINLPRFCTRQFEDRSLFEILSRHYHLEVKGGTQRIHAIPADKLSARYLKIQIGMPLLHLQRRIETSRNNYVFYSDLFCNTQDYALFGNF
jgi:GntR family transcriptional regulator/GntR family frlABCD operon transcriptional regulator